MSFGTFFLPGPPEVRHEVLAAMLQPMIPHRGAAFSRLFASIQEGLRAVFQTERPVFIATSSATGLMEAGVRCAPPGPVLALVNGAFSERFAHIAEACGRTVERYSVAWGATHDPVALRARLDERRYAAITVVHSETSTGALNPIETLSAVARDADTLCLIDSVSGMGGAEVRFDAWKLDYVLTGSQKALALPPGLAFAVASESMLANARQKSDKGVYFDLTEFAQYAAQDQAPNTPAISLYYALQRQLTDVMHEGMSARWARHRAMAERTRAWIGETARALDLDLRALVPAELVPAELGSPTVTTIVLPEWLESDALVRDVAARGFTIGAGYGKLKATTFRIGHMGDHSLDGLDACLAVCADALGALARGR